MRVIGPIHYVRNPHPEQRLGFWLPDEGESFPLFVYFHGGGLVHGGYGMRKEAIETLVRHGVGVCGVGYRIYPEAAYPDFIRDAAAGVAYAVKHAGEYGCNGRIYVGGTSAGGYLSMMLAFDPRWLAMHKLKPTDLAGFVHHSGQPTTHFNVLRERGLDRRTVIVDEAAPLYHIKDTDYPPMLFLTSDDDIPTRYEQNQLVLATLKYFGHDMSRFPFILEHGKHGAAADTDREDGENLLGLFILDFMKDNP